MQHLIIAIDGPSASGKGTLAWKLAESLNYAHMDTGALYRLVAHRILEQGLNPDAETDCVTAAQWVENNFNPEQLHNPAIRTDAVAQATSKASAHATVRQILMQIQRNFAHHPPMNRTHKPYAGAILDGRDIGTVVCPDAKLKLFVTASPEIRAQRRFKELQNKGFQTTYEAVLQDMRERDARDSGRSVAPLKPAEDAIILDTSELTPDEALNKAIDLVRQSLA